MKERPLKPQAETICAQAGFAHDDAGGVIPAIQLSTTFPRDQDYALQNGREYKRDDDPTIIHAERVIAQLEGAEACLLFPSGMAAIAAWFRSFPPGARIVLPERGYYGALGWAQRWATAENRAIKRYAPGDPASLAAALADGAEGLWIETPANPMWDVTDIAEAAALGKAAGATVAVDNTAATPVLQKPLELGADMAIHAATKYLNGHSDVLAGAACTSAAAEARLALMRDERRGAGACLGPFDAWLLLRGLRTLPLRMARVSETSLRLAHWLQDVPNVAQVLYPGLTSHPGHAAANAQMRGGYSGMMSILVDGDEARTLDVIRRLRLFRPATSFGGPESLAEHRRTVEGPEHGAPENLIRLSIGLEAFDDLRDDLAQALEV